MRQVLAEQPNEVQQLRAEITKWRQRVPKLIESLRVRGEALSRAERQNRHLHEELEALQERIAAADPHKVSARMTELGRETERLAMDRSRLEKALISLENRNRMLQETVEILTVRLADAVGEIGVLRSLRRAQQPEHRSGDATSQPESVRILLRIRGVGEKTLGLLQEAGIDSVESLAELAEDALDDPGSPLFPHRSRIRKQRWINQAREMLGRIGPITPAS